MDAEFERNQVDVRMVPFSHVTVMTCDLGAILLIMNYIIIIHIQLKLYVYKIIFWNTLKYAFVQDVFALFHVESFSIKMNRLELQFI